MTALTELIILLKKYSNAEFCHNLNETGLKTELNLKNCSNCNENY